MSRWLQLCVYALALTGCSSEQTGDVLPSVPATEQLLDDFHQVRYGNYGCWVDLRDGTSLQLYRVRESEPQPDQVTLLVTHSIVLQKPSLEPAVAGQKPLRELLCSVSMTPSGQPLWQPFPVPNERGELTLLVYHYKGTVAIREADAELQFRIVAATETYEIAGPPIDTLPEVQFDPSSQRMIPVPVTADGADDGAHNSTDNSLN